MTAKIFGLLAAFSTLAAPAFADEGDFQDDAFRPRPPMHRGVTCFAQNGLGRTFGVRGDWRMNRYMLERQAVGECQRESLPFIRFTCRAIGCR